MKKLTWSVTSVAGTYIAIGSYARAPVMKAHSAIEVNLVMIVVYI